MGVALGSRSMTRKQKLCIAGKLSRLGAHWSLGPHVCEAPVSPLAIEVAGYVIRCNHGALIFASLCSPVVHMLYV